LTSSKPPAKGGKKRKKGRQPGHEGRLPRLVLDQRLREALRDLFGVIHRREEMTAAGFQRALETTREQ
jgi:hypothetical protein